MTTSTLVPSVLPCAINGRAYLCEPAYKRTTLDVIRQQSDAGDAPGEHSLSPYGLWRRSRETFHHGAGQRFADGKLSDEARFRSSKGIDPWTEGQASLLNETVLRRASANTNLACFQVGSTVRYPYIVDGNDLLFTVGWHSNVLSDIQATFESGAPTPVGATTGWAAGANTAIAADNAVAAAAGTYYLRLTNSSGGVADISASTAAGTSGARVVPLVPYRLQIGYRKAAAATARSIEAYLDWYDSAGALISSSTMITGFTDSDTWVAARQNTGFHVAPANAYTVAVRYKVLAAAAGEQHYLDNVILYNGTSVSSFAAWRYSDIHAGDAAQAIQSVTTDGFNIWAALGSSGIHRTTRGQTTSTANVPAGTFTLVGYALGRLLAANGNALYEITSPITAPVASQPDTSWTRQNTDFVWSIIAPGRNCIYVAGNSGGNAEIYRIALEKTGDNLSALTAASYLPDGETIHALQFYAGIVILGTSKGVRVASADGQGNLDYGPLIQTSNPVLCLEPQDRFCWFGWTNYDTSSTGLGRIDLGTFVENLVPAYASDIMAVPIPPATTVQGDVLGVCTISPYDFSVYAPLAQRFFAVSGVGFFGENINLNFGTAGQSSEPVKVASGVIESGAIRYNTSERKNVRLLDLRHHALDGTISAEAKYDDVAYASVGSSSTAGSSGSSSPLSFDQTGETSEIRLTLARPTGGRILVGDTVLNSTTITITSGTLSAADVGAPIDGASWSINNVFEAATRILTVTDSTHAVLNRAARGTSTGVTFVIGSAVRGPELVRWTTKALPLPKAPEQFALTLILKSSVLSTAGNGGQRALDVQAEVSAIKALEQARTVVEFQLGNETFTGYVVKSEFEGEHWEGPRRRWSEGKMTVLLQTVAD